VDAGQAGLLAGYVDAVERYDIDRLVTLLHDDAGQSMPPFAMWLQGAADIGRFMLGPGAACRGSRLIAREANGCPAFGHYKPDPDGGDPPGARQGAGTTGGRSVGLDLF